MGALAGEKTPILWFTLPMLQQLGRGPRPGARNSVFVSHVAGGEREQEAAIRSQRRELNSGPPVRGVGVLACIVTAKTKVHSTLTSLDLRFCCGAELMLSSRVPNTALGTKAEVLGEWVSLPGTKAKVLSEWVSLPFCLPPSLLSLEAGSHKKEFPREYSASWPCDTFWALDSHLGFIQLSPLIHSGYVPKPTR